MRPSPRRRRRRGGRGTQRSCTLIAGRGHEVASRSDHARNAINSNARLHRDRRCWRSGGSPRWLSKQRKQHRVEWNWSAPWGVGIGVGTRRGRAIRGLRTADGVGRTHHVPSQGDERPISVQAEGLLHDALDGAPVTLPRWTSNRAKLSRRQPGSRRKSASHDGRFFDRRCAPHGPLSIRAGSPPVGVALHPAARNAGHVLVDAGCAVHHGDPRRRRLRENVAADSDVASRRHGTSGGDRGPRTRAAVSGSFPFGRRRGSAETGDGARSSATASARGRFV